MRILLETTVLGDDNLALAPITDLSVNGQQVVEEQQFVRAATAAFVPRENESVRVQFTALRTCGSRRAADAFALMHWQSVPHAGLLAIVCGSGADLQTVYLRDALLTAAQVVDRRGVSVRVQYAFVGSKLETEIPVEALPGEPAPQEENPVKRRGPTAIPAGVSSLAVPFASPLASQPVVFVSVSRPTGGARIDAVLCKETVTVNGFTVELSAPTPDDTYQLEWVAYE